MKKYIYAIAALFTAAIGLQSCVEEDGAGVPAPKSMHMEADQYTVNLTDDEVQTLTLRWIDVENATYSVTLTNAENDVTETLNNEVAKGELNVLSMNIPYSQLAAYVEKAELTAQVDQDAPESKSTYQFLINITGKPVNLNQPTALNPEGSTVTATVKFVE